MVPYSVRGQESLLSRKFPVSGTFPSQCFSHSQGFTPPKAFVGLFHPTAAPGVFAFRALLRPEIRSPLGADPLLPLPYTPRQPRRPDEEIEKSKWIPRDPIQPSRQLGFRGFPLRSAVLLWPSRQARPRGIALLTFLALRSFYLSALAPVTWHLPPCAFAAGHPKAARNQHFTVLRCRKAA